MKQDRSESGSAAVEFALVIPLIALLCCAVIDYGQAVNLGTELRSAARAGAQYALAHPADSTGITWAAQHATKESLATTDITLATSTNPTDARNPFPYYCTCTDGDPSVTPVNCLTGTCTTGTKKYFVSVTASRTYTPILPYPGLASSIPVSGSAVMQIQ